MKTRLIIVDISSFIFRAYYAIRPLHAPDGTPVNAVHGIWSMMYKLLSKYQPTHIYLARDSKATTLRKEIYPEYKANRDGPPEDLIPQFDLITKLVDLMGLHNHSIDGREADDLIGSACTQWGDKFDEVYIASGDKDLMQFVGKNIYMLDTMKDKVYARDDVFEKMGVWPEQIVDYLSIVGDSSDNIPGMFGIGAKGAAKLLAEYKTLEGCIENKEKLKGKRVIEAFENHLDKALLSKKLVEIVTNLDLGMSSKDTVFHFHPRPELKDFFKEMGFKSALNKLDDLSLGEYDAAQAGSEGNIHILEEKISRSKTHEIVTQDNLNAVKTLLADSRDLSFSPVYDGNDPFSANLISFSISFDGKHSYYFPVTHTNYQGELLVPADEVNLPEALVETILTTMWKNEKNIIFDESKFSQIYFMSRYGEMLATTDEVAQMYFVLGPSRRFDLVSVCDQELGFQLTEFEKGAPPLDEQGIEIASAYLGERACCLFELKEILGKELKEKELLKVYEDIDLPCFRALAKMETEGIYVNKNFLQELEKKLEARIGEISQTIQRESDSEVNLRSPKQVGELLFEKLNFPIIKKTKTGASTDSEVLEELVQRGYEEIPSLILKFRELDKILSTYVKALPALINAKTGRVHTSFKMAVAATGRLSSVNPNLQNIPIRSEEGRLVRKAFIASPGKLLLAADYSQIELRILAHLSGDPTMINSFRKGEDIHAQTASEILGIDISEVTSDDRAKAKAVNFGLIYGQSSFGLAKALGISRKEAKDYITRYFEKFGHIKSFLDSLKEACEKTGYAKTMFGRKRDLPDINSQNRTIKANAERVAINSPIQGSAADLIKMAMVNIDRAMAEQKLKSKMLLQVHDELIFEVFEEEISKMKALVSSEMENVVKLTVPLKVDMGMGVNWYDLK